MQIRSPQWRKGILKIYLLLTATTILNEVNLGGRDNYRVQILSAYFCRYPVACVAACSYFSLTSCTWEYQQQLRCIEFSTFISLFNPLWIKILSNPTYASVIRWGYLCRTDLPTTGEDASHGGEPHVLVQEDVVEDADLDTHLVLRPPLRPYQIFFKVKRISSNQRYGPVQKTVFRISDILLQIRLRNLLFSSLTFTSATKNYLFSKFFCLLLFKCTFTSLSQH